MNEPSTCSRCTAVTAEGIRLCSPCAEELSTLLVRAREAAALAVDTIARLDVTGSSGGGSSTTPPAPISLEASLRVDDLLEAMRYWLDVVSARPVGVSSVPRASHALAERLAVIIGLDYAGQIFEEIRRLTARVMRAVDLPPDTYRAGACTECGSAVVAERGAETGSCVECGAGHAAAAMHAEKIERAWRVHAPLSRVVAVLQTMGYPVKLNTAKSWIRRGLLDAQSRTPDGVACYSPAQLVGLHNRQGCT